MRLLALVLAFASGAWTMFYFSHGEPIVEGGLALSLALAAVLTQFSLTLGKP